MAMADMQGELLWLKYTALFLIGPWDIKLAVLAMFLLIDLSSGVYAARHRGEYSRAVLMDKTKRKFFVYLAAVMCLNLLDIGFGLPNTLRNGALVILIGSEFLSVASHMGRLGHGKVENMLKGFYEQLMNHQPEEKKKTGEPEEKKRRGEKDEGS